jgi:hypothetical protein
MAFCATEHTSRCEQRVKAIRALPAVDFNEWRFGFLRFPFGISLGGGPLFFGGGVQVDSGDWPLQMEVDHKAAGRTLVVNGC